MTRLQLKIIDLLSKNREKKFTINEITKTLKESYSFVNRTINKLVKDKVILKEKIGKAHICTLNLENDKTMVLMHLNEVNQTQEFYQKNKETKLLLEDFIKNLKTQLKENLIFIALFGSYAKETQTKESDIDIIILTKKKTDITSTIREIHAKYGKEITPIIMTPKEIQQQKDKPIIKEIIKYHKILYGYEQFIQNTYLK